MIPLADRVAVYAAMDVKTASLFGLEHSKDENFRNRMRLWRGGWGRESRWRGITRGLKDPSGTNSQGPR